MQLFARDYKISIDHTDENVFTVNCSLSDSLHNLILTQKVTIEKPRILSGQLKVIKAPNERCKQLELLPERLNGLTIDKGFTKAVIDKLGGAGGCVNLVNMVLVSVPLVINTSWLYYAHTGKYSFQEIKNIEKQQMSGLCLGYPPDTALESENISTKGGEVN
ncbi:MAG: DUF2889 domain-containing protein [Clostridia bacterium]|nr:DUF2889 domain-containing protein [Clostridia bacterium]